MLTTVSVYQCVCWCGVLVLTAVFLSLSVCLLSWCPGVNSSVSVSISVSVGVVSGRYPSVNNCFCLSVCLLVWCFGVNSSVSVYQCVCWHGVPVLTAMFLSISVSVVFVSRCFCLYQCVCWRGVPVLTAVFLSISVSVGVVFRC